MAPKKPFQPSATAGEWRRARSSGCSGRGARRASTLATMALSSAVGKALGSLGSTYGRRMAGGCLMMGVVGGLFVFSSADGLLYWTLPRGESCARLASCSGR